MRRVAHTGGGVALMLLGLAPAFVGCGSSADAKAIQAGSDGSAVGVALLREGWRPVDVNSTQLQSDMDGADPDLENGYVFVGYTKGSAGTIGVELVTAGLATASGGYYHFTVEGAVYDGDTDVFGRSPSDPVAQVKHDVQQAGLSSYRDTATVGPDRLAQNS